jgi:hypothetical protein
MEAPGLLTIHSFALYLAFKATCRGHELIAAKEAHGHGKFAAWVAANIKCGERRARDYMAYARDESKLEEKRAKDRERQTDLRANRKDRADLPVPVPPSERQPGETAADFSKRRASYSADVIPFPAGGKPKNDSEARAERASRFLRSARMSAADFGAIFSGMPRASAINS